MHPLRSHSLGLAMAFGLGHVAAFAPTAPLNHHRVTLAPMSLQLQMQTGPSQRIGSTRPARRSFSSLSLSYKVDIEPMPEPSAEQMEPQAGGGSALGKLPPLDWAGKPIDSIRTLFSDYAPRMKESEAFLWLLFVVGLCGVNFPLTKFVGETFDGPTLLTARFAIASACFIPWIPSIKKELLPSGIETGSWLAAGYITQALCLTGGTNSGVASFMASMSCVLCPFFERAVGVKLGWRAYAAAATGLLSAFVLELGPGYLVGGDSVGLAMPTSSDIIGLLQPVFFGLYLFRTELVMQKNPSEAMQLTAIQVIATTLVCGSWGLFNSDLLSGGFPEVSDLVAQVSASVESLQDLSALQGNGLAILGLIWMGMMPSGLALALETVIVHKLSSSVTALTFTLEPVFAAAFGGLMLHEEFGLATGLGGALAISAVLIRCADPQQLQATADGIKARLNPKNP